ncbi:MAG TPA: DUF1003 domain-containing protein [Candidatus Dormibacteraeota bacterium]|nr:DUF1003 domain-containing protein [Candidatus Dormibacteraeota bacterium]
MKQPRKRPTVAVLDRNIKALLARKQLDEQEQSWEEKLASAITKFTGSLFFIALHVVVYGLWIVLELRKGGDLVTLTVVASIEAIFLSVFILITQRRMIANAERRADLTLQIGLLAEYEVTRLLTLTKEIAKTMGIKEADEPELDELARDVAPEEVLERLDEHQERMEDSG